MSPAPATLALAASGSPASCALRCGGQLFGPVPAPGGGAGLAAVAAGLFGDAGIGPADLATVLLDLGPGSYTGLRVAVTHAQFCRRYLGAEVRTITSLELMAVAAWRAGTLDRSRPVRPVIDARRGRFHHALIALDVDAGSAARLIEAPRATSLEELRACLRPEQMLLSADLEGTGLGKPIAPSPRDAATMFDPLLGFRPAGGDLEPLYLMGTYAEPAP